MIIKHAILPILKATSLLFSPIGGAAIFSVTNIDDTGAGSLRVAIEEANASAGADTIHFNIPSAGVGAAVIKPLSPLPWVLHKLTIDGYTQTGSYQASTSFLGGTVNARINVVLDGSLAGFSTDGLVVWTNNSRIRGLVIKNFEGNGVIFSGDNNKLQGNYIGTNKWGTSVRANGGNGVSVSGDSNTIGGTDVGHKNLISGNLYTGLSIDGDDNLIQGNIIGLDITTLEDFGNGPTSGGSGYISGLSIAGSNNLIGGTEIHARNIISGNATGVLLYSGEANKVQGNIIGTDDTGNSSLIGIGNSTGITVLSPNNEIGGTEPGSGNLISNNIGFGLEIVSNDNTVQGNFIGTNKNGSSALGNNSSGIVIYGERNLVGGLMDGAANLISGNRSSGILIRSSLSIYETTVAAQPAFNLVQGNYIGTDVSGIYAIANGSNGVHIYDANTTLIGGLIASAANVISGNEDNGVLIESFQEDLESRFNLIFGNIIGADAEGVFALPNLLSGVRIIGAESNRIGGKAAMAGNDITYNGADGVTIESGEGNAILRNQIKYNSDLGIDLEDDGVTINDYEDPDAGANSLQNFPLIDSATADAISTTVEVSFGSVANSSYRLEFFNSATCSASGHGEAETYLGSATLVTLGYGAGPVSATYVLNTPTSAGDNVVATASQLVGGVAVNTSEFSPCTSVN